MVSFLADENFDNRILRGLLLIEPVIDILRVQDTSVAEADDLAVLEFALNENRILLTHDIKTIPVFFLENLQNGIPNPGVFIIKTSLFIKDVIDDLFLIAACSDSQEWNGKIFFLPL